MTILPLPYAGLCLRSPLCLKNRQWRARLPQKSDLAFLLLHVGPVSQIAVDGHAHAGISHGSCFYVRRIHAFAD